MHATSETLHHLVKLDSDSDDMAEAAACQNFGDWLSLKLEQLNIDQDVFGSYISSIVETDDSNEEEKSEALNGILGGILV